MLIIAPFFKLTARLSLLALLLTIGTAIIAEANTNVDELQRKIADITLLKKQLEDRRKQAESAIEALLVQQKDLVAEVHLLSNSLNLKSYQDAQKHLRIRYDIDLLRTITTYLQEFETKIHLYQTGSDKLTYLQHLAEDTVQMISTLSDYQIDALTTQISLVINQYLDEAHNIHIDLRNIEMASGERVWENVIKN